MCNSIHNFRKNEIIKFGMPFSRKNEIRTIAVPIVIYTLKGL